MTTTDRSLPDHPSSIMRSNERSPGHYARTLWGGAQALRLLLMSGTWVLLSTPAHASFLAGDALDSMANVMSWVAIFLTPVIGIGVFWFLHIMPEKVAEKRRHPQLAAIKALCLLSLFFGGLLWPLAWIWAYSKPTLHKLAYGTDVDESLPHHPDKKEQELEELRSQVAELRAQIEAGTTNTKTA
jgi:CBS domain containing-hemolysin-like protein